MDELTHVTEAMYRLLCNRARKVGVFLRIPTSSNPRHIGHAWVKVF